MKIVKESIINEVKRSEDEWADREIKNWKEQASREKQERMTGIKYKWADPEDYKVDSHEDSERYALAARVSNLEKEIGKSGHKDIWDKWRRFVLNDLVADREDVTNWMDFDIEQLQIALDEAEFLLRRIKNKH